jgi:hypothetical protein
MTDEELKQIMTKHGLFDIPLPHAARAEMAIREAMDAEIKTLIQWIHNKYLSAYPEFLSSSQLYTEFKKENK